MRLTVALKQDLTRARALLLRERLGPDGKAALTLLRALCSTEARRPAESGQLVLALLKPDDLVPCETLHANLPARVCVMRQQVSDLQQTQDRWRGTASDYPHCVTSRCAEGRNRRAILDPEHKASTKGVGPGGRFLYRTPDSRGQMEARNRLAAVGLLDEVSTVDAPAGEE